MTTQSRIGELLDELDIESWLDAEGIRHKRTRGTSGLQLNVRECPCCGNSNWKVYLNAESGAGNCFVCDWKFSKWGFIKESLGADSRTTFQNIENFVQAQGWKSEPSSPKVQPKAALILPESIPIPVNGRNLKYLAQRGISASMAERFGLRYSDSGVYWYRNAYGKMDFQDYSKRVIIPIYDIDGKLASFQGRDITGLAPKKYLFPPEYATTGSVLYNLHNVKDKQTLVIGEGVFDAFAIQAALDLDVRFKNYGAVASFGKKLAEAQIATLRSLAAAGTLRSVVIMWDAEEKALDAAVDAALACKSVGILTRVAVLPAGCDPNEVTAEEVQGALWDSVTISPLEAIKLKIRAKALRPAVSY